MIRSHESSPVLPCALAAGIAILTAAGAAGEATAGETVGLEELLFQEVPAVAAALSGEPADDRAGARRAAAVPGLEELLFVEIPVVVSATRSELSALDAPNAVTVITAEEIRAIGATRLADVLAAVPGLDLMRITNGDAQLSVRGLNQPSNSNLLVMVDGRSVYLDFFGNVLWDTLPVSLQEIERIEVVRGPGSVLYGANALLGTVNIITRDPESLPSGFARATVGQRTNLFTATVAQAGPRISYKASGQFEQRSAFRNERNPASNAQSGRDDTALRSRHGSAAVHLRPADDLEIRLAGGFQRAGASLLITTTTVTGEHDTGWAQMDLDHGPWSLKAFYSRYSQKDATEVLQFPPFPTTAGIFSILSTTTDLDLQRSVSWGDHELILGGNLRRVMTDSDIVIGSREQEMLYAGFIHDEFPVSERLEAFLGVRVDRHPKTGWNASPRASLVYRLGETERMRVSVARAFRNPTQLWTYMSDDVIPGTLTLVGNEDIDPVELTAYEIGFEGRLHSRVHGKLDLYYNVLNDFQQSVPLNPLGPPPFLVSFRNVGPTRAWGGEASLDWRLSESTRAFASYAYESAHGPLEQATPPHKASAGVRGGVGPRLRYALTGTYVGHTKFEDAVPSTTAGTVGGIPHALRIRSRLTVDAYLGFEVVKGTELGFHARNLFHQVRRHHPLGDEIGSELLLTLTGSF